MKPGTLLISAAAILMSSSQDKPLKVAIVNMKDCFEEEKNTKVKALQTELNEGKGAIQRELQDLDAQIKAQRGKLEDLPADSPMLDRAREKLAELDALRQVKEKMGQARLQDFFRRSRIKVFEEVCRAAEGIAKKKGISLVLKDDSQATTDQQIVYRAVLYFDEAFDITPEVLREINR